MVARQWGAEDRASSRERPAENLAADVSLCEVLVQVPVVAVTHSIAVKYPCSSHVGSCEDSRRGAGAAFMLGLYVGTLVFGGGLLAIASLFGGGDHEVDHDMDLDGDFDVDVDADLDVDLDGDVGLDVDEAILDIADNLPAVAKDFDLEGSDLWLPFMSVRFWTFGSTFFGAFGTLGTLLGLGSPVTVLVGSVAVGSITGSVASTAIRHLKKNALDSSIRPDELTGVTATVLLPITSERDGKVRIEVRGYSMDMRAGVLGHEPIPEDAEVLVVEHQGHRLIVEAI